MAAPNEITIKDLSGEWVMVSQQISNCPLNPQKPSIFRSLVLVPLCCGQKNQSHQVPVHVLHELGIS